MNRVSENNNLKITGEISSDFEYSHEMYGEKFYISHIKSKRKSGTYDIIPFMISDRMIRIEDLTGVCVSILGQFRSYNRHENGKSVLELYIFVLEMKQLEKTDFDFNNIELQGYICKPPTYRKTPLDRDITDVILAVNRPYGKSDYIPCVCWGRGANYVSTLEVGTKLNIVGRMQSRDYKKHISDTEFELRTAYEISISKVEVGDEK